MRERSTRGERTRSGTRDGEHPVAEPANCALPAHGVRLDPAFPFMGRLAEDVPKAAMDAPGLPFTIRQAGRQTTVQLDAMAADSNASRLIPVSVSHPWPDLSPRSCTEFSVTSAYSSWPESCPLCDLGCMRGSVVGTPRFRARRRSGVRGSRREAPPVGLGAWARGAVLRCARVSPRVRVAALLRGRLHGGLAGSGRLLGLSVLVPGRAVVAGKSSSCAMVPFAEALAKMKVVVGSTAFAVHLGRCATRARSPSLRRTRTVARRADFLRRTADFPMVSASVLRSTPSLSPESARSSGGTSFCMVKLKSTPTSSASGVVRVHFCTNLARTLRGTRSAP